MTRSRTGAKSSQAITRLPPCTYPVVRPGASSARIAPSAPVHSEDRGMDRNHTSDDARRHLTRRHALTVLASWDLRAQFSRRQVAPSNRCRLCMTPFRQVDRIGASIA